MLRSRGKYSSSFQIDAVAVCPFLNGPSNETQVEEGKDQGDSSVLAVAFSSLEGNEWGGGIALVESTTSETLCQFQLPTGISSVAWGGIEQDHLICACDNGDIEIARVITDVEFSVVPQTNADHVGHDDVVTGISTSILDKTRFATSSWDLTVQLWDITAMTTSLATFENHTDLVWTICTSPLTPNVLASGSQDCTIQIWDDRQINSTTSISTLFPVLSFDWHPCKETIFAAGLENGSLLTYDIRFPSAPLNELTLHQGPIHTIKYSPYHNDLLASGGDDKSFYLLHGLGTKQPQGFELNHERQQFIRTENHSHDDYVRGLEWFKGPSKETLLASASWDKTLCSWEVDPQITSV